MLPALADNRSQAWPAGHHGRAQSAELSVVRNSKPYFLQCLSLRYMLRVRCVQARPAHSTRISQDGR